MIKGRILRNPERIIMVMKDYRVKPQVPTPQQAEKPTTPNREIIHRKTRSCLTELSEEAKIVGVEVADIIDTVMYHRDPFYPHTEGKTGNLIWIVAYIA